MRKLPNLQFSIRLVHFLLYDLCLQMSYMSTEKPSQLNRGQGQPANKYH